jgi:hypothetical protein
MFEQKSKDALQHVYDLIHQNQRLLEDRKRLRTRLGMFMDEEDDRSCHKTGFAGYSSSISTHDMTETL